MRQSTLKFHQKILILLSVVAIIPILAANLIFWQVNSIVGHSSFLSAVKSLPSQEKTRLDILEYIRSVESQIERLQTDLQTLAQRGRLFLGVSIFFVPFTMIGAWFFLNSIVRPIRELTAKLNHFQNEGRIEDDEDLLACSKTFEIFLHTSRALLAEIHSICDNLKKKMDPLTTMVAFSDENMRNFFTDVQEISRSSNYIANTLESTTASIEEVSTSAQTIADRSHQAAQKSSDAASIATVGRQAVSETIETMESIQDEVLGLEDVIADLNSASKQIGEIVNTITNIAHQTNLLALNAAIEAARAGEQGRGFTVVAEEVRMLAEEAGEAADDIGKKVKGMLEKTGIAVQSINKGTGKVVDGVKVVNVAGDNLTQIVTSVTQVNKMIQEISQASTEQSSNIDSLTHSIESISGATKMTSEGTKRVVTAVNEQLNYIRQYVAMTKDMCLLLQIMGDMLSKFNLQ